MEYSHKSKVKKLSCVLITSHHRQRESRRSPKLQGRPPKGYFRTRPQSCSLFHVLQRKVYQIYFRWYKRWTEDWVLLKQVIKNCSWEWIWVQAFNYVYFSNASTNTCTTVVCYLKPIWPRATSLNYESVYINIIPDLPIKSDSVITAFTDVTLVREN